MQVGVRVFPARQPCLFVFGAQPLTQPFTGVSIHCPIGFADWPETEVVGPTVHHLIELRHHRLMVQLGSISSSLAADRLTDANHSLLGRNRAQIGASSLRRVATAKRIPQEVELFFRQFRDPRLGLIHRQLQLRHHDPHRGQSFFRFAPTTDHEIIGIVDDVRSETLFVPQLLPSKHEPTHVKITEQRADHAPYTKGNFEFERVVRGWRTSYAVLDLRLKR